MKKFFFSIRQVAVLSSGFVLMVALLSACKKNSDNTVDIPVAGLMAFNLSPDKPALGIALSGNLVTNSPLAYTNYTGDYRNIYPGDRSVKSYDFEKDTTLISSNFNFETKKYYSLFVVGNNGAYKNVIVHDDIDSLPSAQAYIRYINAIPDSSTPTVIVKANGNNVFNSLAPFTTVSGFTAVNAGDVNVAVANGNTISANRTITVENGRIYTVLLVGVPGATDNLKAVQIKYILNGVLIDD
ncbi:MAG: DUF4397 domain-containing protein, partial [Chitinophagaceae bacterium]|nr:DUF4397 domain-containing protein [Chitinophagaceae bacterium]